MAIIYSGAIARITLRADKFVRIAFVATAATLGPGAVEAANLAPGAAAANLGATAAQLRDRSTHTGAQAISTVTGLQTALDLKAPLASPALTGTPTAPTAPDGTNTTQLATTAFVRAAIAALIASSPAALDTLDELAAALGDDPNFAATTATALGNRVRVDTASQGLNSTQQSNARANIGALASADYTASDVLTKVKTVDGSGSGLDADLLRGTTPSAFALTVLDDADAGTMRATLGANNASNLNAGTVPDARLPGRLTSYEVLSSNANSITNYGVYLWVPGATNTPEGAGAATGYGWLENFGDAVSGHQEAVSTDGVNAWVRSKSGSVWGAWQTHRKSESALDARYAMVTNLLASLTGGVDTANDLVAVYDASAGATRKMSVASLISSGTAGVSTFNGRSGLVSPTSGDYNAGQITNTPAGNIAATNVQAALNELDSEKGGLGLSNTWTAENTFSQMLTASAGLRYGRALYLGNNIDLNGDYPAGFYDVQNPQNGPWLMPFAYLEVIRHWADPGNWQKQTLTSFGAGAESPYPVVWQRIKRAGAWGPWRPVSGYVTPEDLGGSPAGTMQGASTDETLAVARWIDFGLAHPTVPMVLNGFYRITAPINRSIGANNGFGIRSIGPASRAGFYMSGSTSRIYVEGADHDNPSGFNADQYQFSDFMIGIDADRTEPCLMMVAAPDTGSAAPGLSMRNVHQRRASDGAGVTGTVFLMVGIRYFDVQDVSGQGKYFGYQGNLFLLGDGPGGAPVEGCFTNIRMDHCGDMFRLAGSTGDVAYDDWQGMHFDRCTGLAVNKLVYMTTGPENPGFSEWVTVSRCHAYFREAAVLSEKVGNLKINDCYFLGHGNLPVIQGVGKSGTSIVDVVNITNTTFKFDASGATRLGINVPVSQKGKQWGNSFQNATGNNYGELENSSSTTIF